MNSPFPALVGTTIVLGITGSIAAYKAADLASKLRRAGAEVWPVMTAGAQRFVTPLTLQAVAHHPVATDLWSENDPAVVAHVDLADRADLLLVAPATANTLAQFAHGLAPDFLSSLYLVCRAPVLIAPAMNGKMWSHPATQANVATLRARGHAFIGPEEGMQACGYEGVGRLWPIEGIVAEAARMLAASD
ncbi:MAG: phosphopantothenoylcysteine decarboxylase [Opitutaceae bacterium]|nr:phosphopantothenoylcysteine decarboxylase [Opitutaceae bacterium]